MLLLSCQAISFTHLLAPSERKRLQYEGSAYLQKTCPNYTKAKKLHAPLITLSKTKKYWKMCGLASTVRFVVTMENTANQWSCVFHK